MRTDNRQSIIAETWEEQKAAGRYNPASVAVWRSARGCHRWTLNCGTSDDVNFYREAGLVYCVSINRGLGYVGIQAFSEITNGEIGDYFCQDYAANFDADFPKNRTQFYDLTGINQAKYLAGLLAELYD